ncbi:MAG TPA: TetR/AcrR family transcriptional regulator [Porticoccaceae bacterium]|nr:TetR/AcrR family transcriptional regulator [Porticoccaceae bacterium]
MNKVRWGKSIQSKDEQYELKRAAILRTAGRLFNQKGFRETSLNDLADELQVTKPTLYYYVENKEDILFQCLHTAIIELLDKTDTILDSANTGIEKLTDFIHLFISVFDDEFGRCLARPGPEPLSDKYLDQIEPLYVRLDASMREMIDDGIADGSMRACNAKITAFTLFGAINWMTRWYQPEGEMTTRQVADEMARLFVHGLARA